MNKPLKIVYCLPSLYIAGGMERVLTLKANYLADVAGHDICLILTDGNGKAPFYELSERITVVNLGIDFDELWHVPLYKKVWMYIAKQRLYKKLLRKQLMQIRPDITVSMLRREINFITSIKDGSVKMGEIHMSKINFRKLPQEDGGNRFPNNIFAKLWMWQLVSKLRKLSTFVTLTHEDSQQWHGLHNLRVIHNPLSFYPEQQSNGTSRQVIAVGRYSHAKGYDMLLEAWKQVIQRHPDWVLRIYGHGRREELQQYADRLCINEYCHLETSVPNIVTKLCESSILVLSSRCEGMPMVLGEAMACGVPPVAFTCPCGPRDIISDGTDGLLVENGNIEQLAEKLCYLIEHDTLRQEMGRQARIKASSFLIENIGKQWDELFRELASHHQSN